MPRIDLLQTRSGTALEWSTVNPVLDLHEQGDETDTLKTKRGDGVTAWNSLPYFNEGGGGGDMTKAVYDPNDIEADAFDSANEVVDDSSFVVLTGVNSQAVFNDVDSKLNDIANSISLPPYIPISAVTLTEDFITLNDELVLSRYGEQAKINEPTLSITSEDYFRDISLYKSAIPSRTPIDLDFIRIGNGTYIDKLKTMQTLGSARIRIDYATNRKGILLEADATNLLVNSETFATENFTTLAQDYTISFYGTGTITLSGTSTEVLVGVDNKTKVIKTFTATAGTLTITPSGVVNTPQLEAGVLGSSYIPTTAGALSRNEDQLELEDVTIVQNLFESEDSFAFVIDFFNYNNEYNATSTVFTIDDNTSSNKIELRYLNTGALNLATNVAGDNNSNSFYSTPVNGRLKIGVSYLDGIATIYANGVIVGTVTSTSSKWSALLNSIRFGKGRSTSSNWSGVMYAFDFYKEATDLSIETQNSLPSELSSFIVFEGAFDNANTGLTYDASRDLLYVVSTPERKIYKYNSLGFYKGKLDLPATQGIAYDGLRDYLYAMDGTTLKTYDLTDNSLVNEQLSFDPYGDGTPAGSLAYNSTDDKLIFSGSSKTHFIELTLSGVTWGTPISMNFGLNVSEGIEHDSRDDTYWVNLQFGSKFAHVDNTMTVIQTYQYPYKIGFDNEGITLIPSLDILLFNSDTGFKDGVVNENRIYRVDMTKL